MATERHTSVPVAEFRANLGDAISRSAYAGERIVITKHGKPAAALISADDLEYLEELEASADVAALKEARANDDGVRYSAAEVHASLGLD
ncbi:MAG: type II toxin-antitoxin system Phd/YefM family antitoxin [Gordonia sp. (in: high G+C Gram-positive bacteria)]|uniref:type II toxin-antitoxin system Phd/YefM family antitoxin n=1 Tax=Gordonia sp. (in: high G+C Gram-positive bacteria) TaxID=84139 RepID=UPI0039E6BED7